MDKKLHEIHIQTIVEGYASALVHSLDWENRVSLTLLDIQEINDFADHLDRNLEPIVDLSYEDVRVIVENYVYMRRKHNTEQSKAIINHTTKYVQLETNDMEKFESWLKTTMQKIGMTKTF